MVPRFHRASHEVGVLWAVHQVHHSSQYCTVLYCTVLYCTVLYCTVLHQVHHSSQYFNLTTALRCRAEDDR